MNDELINFDLPVDRSSMIKVLGVGGGGSNAVNYMYRQGIKDVDFVICNTDSQALANSPVPVKIQIGSSLTEGRGAGNKPEVGRQAAIENLDDITEVLSSNTKMIFITAGMGGGTGTGAAPVIAKQAKELGILTVAIVTIPFRNEGKRRINQALDGIAEIEQYVDSLLIINNEKIREIYGDLKVSQAFHQADNVLAVAARGIAEIITVHGYINVDFADVETVMLDSGVAIMGAAEGEGEDRALIAVKEALTSPLLNDNDIKGARNILINITSGENEITMDEIGLITDFVQDCAGQDADLIWGNGVDENLGDKICVTVIATGFTTRSIPELYAKRRSQSKIPLSAPREKEHNKYKLEDEVNDDFNQEDLKQNEQRVIEFDIHDEANEKYVLYDDNKINDLDSPDEIKKTTEKVHEIKQEHNRLKEKTYNNLDNKEDIDELENQPAYIRKKIKIKNAKYSDEDEVSRFSLDEDENGTTRLSSDNPYLHDNVD